MRANRFTCKACNQRHYQAGSGTLDGKRFCNDCLTDKSDKCREIAAASKKN